MVLTTSQLRSAYGPHCQTRDWGMEQAYSALDFCLQHHGYAPRLEDTGSYNCRPITGGTNYSLHAYRDDSTFIFFNGVKVTIALAVDINWKSNPYGPRLVTDMPREMVDDILEIRTNSGERVWGWGGYYSGNKDAMHYEIVCSPAALRSGINLATLPGTQIPQPPIKENNMGKEAIYTQADDTIRAIVLGTDNKAYHFVGTKDPRSLKQATGAVIPGKWKSISACVVKNHPDVWDEVVWGQGTDNDAWFTYWSPEEGWHDPVKHPTAHILVT